MKHLLKTIFISFIKSILSSFDELIFIYLKPYIKKSMKHLEFNQYSIIMSCI